MRGNISCSGTLAPYVPEMQELFEYQCSSLSGGVYGLPEQSFPASSVSSATASSSGGRTTVKITFKDFSVSAAEFENIEDISGIPGDITGLFDALGTDLDTGADTVKINLSNGYVDCVIDERTGEIIDGTWNFDVDFTIGNASIDLDTETVTIVDLRIPMRLRATV